MKNIKSKIKNEKSKIVLFVAIILGFAACKKKDTAGTPDPSTPPVNETELITTVKLILRDTANTNDARIANFYDIDGPGGNAPMILDTISLSPNKVYQTEIYLLDDSKNPADSVSNQVRSEGADHLFVFTKTGVNVSINITDRDKNNLPIGLSSYWSTGAVSSGTMKVTLKHQPGVKNGTAAPGETDVEVVFPCRVK